MMKEDLKIDRVLLEEVDTIVSIVRSSFKERHLIASIYRGGGISNYISAELENPCSCTYYLAFKMNEEIIGGADLKGYNGTIFLNIICMSSRLKNNGFGSKFLDELFIYFKQLGYVEMHLDVFESNTTALKWYLKAGFEISSLKYFKIGQPHTYSEKHLTIFNYPQFKNEMDSFGFSVLKIGDGSGSSMELGKVEHEFVFRGNTTEQEYMLGSSLLNKISSNKQFFFFQDSNDERLGKNFDLLYRLKKRL